MSKQRITPIRLKADPEVIRRAFETAAKAMDDFCRACARIARKGRK